MSTDKNLVVSIDRLGGQGDGIAQTLDELLFIPQTLPGEEVEVERDEEQVRAKKIITPSEHRRKAPCRYFGKCGGCSLQHMRADYYTNFKKQMVTQALEKQGIAPPELTGLDIETIYRRRCFLSAKRTKKSVILGYHSPRSHTLMDVEECLLLPPALNNILPDIKQLVLPLLSRKQEGRIGLVAADNGVDVSIENVKPLESATIREQIAEQAHNVGICRLSVNGSPVMLKEAPYITLADGTIIQLPADVFLQASGEVQNAMTKALIEKLSPFKLTKVADLFAGLGAFSFPMARTTEVKAFELDETAVQSFEHTILNNKGLKKIEIFRRDLFKHPLSAREMREFDGLIFDPPRAGCLNQAKELAKSEISVIAGISCNPATFARDAALLIEGGYVLESLQAFDQFLYSTHTEIIGIFVKK